MSEWKMCLDCHHGYKDHYEATGETTRTVRPVLGACFVVGCDCEAFYNVMENF